ncbi:hypothetical protein ACUN24_25535 [Pedobacter sp. WC2501]|uniref:hypothetical protein n=1 Tax=Pedobacter sp. WC2501 TaxID=3461400 RepID=UPI0040467E52
MFFVKQGLVLFGYYSPAIRSNLFKTTVMLRNEESVSSVADASCLSITVYPRLLQLKSISTTIRFRKAESVRQTRTPPA